MQPLNPAEQSQPMLPSPCWQWPIKLHQQDDSSGFVAHSESAKVARLTSPLQVSTATYDCAPLSTVADTSIQATVQATLANLPMDQVQSTYATTDPAYAENMRWAEDALVTAVFCIIICGAWGTLSIRYLAPFLLQKVRAHHIEVFCRHATHTPENHYRGQVSAAD